MHLLHRSTLRTAEEHRSGWTCSSITTRLASINRFEHVPPQMQVCTTIRRVANLTIRIPIVSNSAYNPPNEAPFPHLSSLRTYVTHKSPSSSSLPDYSSQTLPASGSNYVNMQASQSFSNAGHVQTSSSSATALPFTHTHPGLYTTTDLSHLTPTSAVTVYSGSYYHSRLSFY